MLCEIKSPEIPLSQDTLNQISQYNSVIQAPHLLVTNGLELWFFSLDEAGKYQMKEWCFRMIGTSHHRKLIPPS
ncbi:MAG: type I restriction enzyme HsdR N-terminal domain-containing protein [Bacteroidia bacterium]